MWVFSNEYYYRYDQTARLVFGISAIIFLLPRPIALWVIKGVRRDLESEGGRVIMIPE